MKRIPIILMSIMIAYMGMAQTLPTEKVFFASNRMHYASGDTIRVSGWLVRTDNMTTLPYSQYLYLEMVDASDSIFARQKISVDENGAFTTLLPIDFKAPQGAYFLRAFSKMMCNFSDITIPTFPIEIRKEGFTARRTEGGMQCNVFPEGGHLTAGEMQKVAINICDEAGNPWQTSFRITDSDGNTVLSAATTASGWQIIPISPVKGKHYYIKVEGDKEMPLWAMPEIDDSTPALRLSQRKDRIHFRIDGELPKDAKLYSYNQSTGLMLLSVQKQGDVDISGVGTGLTTLILTDKNNHTLSEGHIWQSTSMKQTSEIRTEYNVGEGIAPKEIAAGNSTTIVRFIPLDEAGMAITSDYIPTAEATINFESDLISEMPFPRNYAMESKADRMTDIICWMHSARFGRMDIAKAMEKKYQPEVANTIRGKVYGKGKHWKLKEGSVIAYQRSNAATFTADMHKDGTFHMPVGDYPQGDGFFVSAVDKKNNSDFYDYEFLGDTLPSVRNYKKYALEGSTLQTSANDSWKKFDWDGVNDIPEVRITAHVKKDYVQEEKEFYGNKLLTEEEMDKHNYQTFQQMIYHYAPYMKLIQAGVIVDDDSQGAKKEVVAAGGPPEYHLYPASRLSTLKGSTEIKIFIDGALVTATEAVNINMSDIATVEFLSPAQSLARHAFCLDGCLELTTKGFNPQSIKSKGVMYIPTIGIANYGVAKPEITTPDKPGEYLMIIDCLTEDHQPQTFIQKVSVKESHNSVGDCG